LDSEEDFAAGHGEEPDMAERALSLGMVIPGAHETAVSGLPGDGETNASVNAIRNNQCFPTLAM